jgi:phosphoglycerate dehydrogenase-like enzyme
MTRKIALLQPVAEEMMGIIRRLLPEGFSAEAVGGRSPEDLKATIADAEFAVWWDIPVTADILAAAPRLRLLHKWGVGIDNVDLDAARAQGVAVARTTGSNAVPVAEFAVGLMLALGRSIPRADASTKAGGWDKQGQWRRSRLLGGKTVGIIGFGAIGRMVARRLAGFEVTLLYHSRRRLDAGEEAALGVAWRELDELLAECDVVTLHCPLTPQTVGLIGAPQLARMKPGALLINTARGGVVDEAALVAALRSGHLGGAAVDVFDMEPPPPDHPLLSCDNVIVTPHCAATAYENSERSVRHWLANIERVARGEPIPERDLVQAGR